MASTSHHIQAHYQLWYPFQGHKPRNIHQTPWPCYCHASLCSRSTVIVHPLGDETATPASNQPTAIQLQPLVCVSHANPHKAEVFQPSGNGTAKPNPIQATSMPEIVSGTCNQKFFLREEEIPKHKGKLRHIQGTKILCTLGLLLQEFSKTCCHPGCYEVLAVSHVFNGTSTTIHRKCHKGRKGKFIHQKRMVMELQLPIYRYCTCGSHSLYNSSFSLASIEYS